MEYIKGHSTGNIKEERNKRTEYMYVIGIYVHRLSAENTVVPK